MSAFIDVDFQAMVDELVECQFNTSLTYTSPNHHFPHFPAFP
jgi:hypothetical protein